MATPELLTLEVATPKGLALRTEADNVQAPSVEGEFGVLPGHLPLLAALRCGLLRYRNGTKHFVAAVGPGFVEAEPDKVLLLTSLFALPADIDADSVGGELEAANKALVTHYDSRKKRLEDLKSSDATQEDVQHTLDAMEREAHELRRDIAWAEARLQAKRIAESN